VAEGAETEDHVNQLKKLGCELAQGYYFSKPVDADAIARLLAHFKWNTRAAAASL
jgi:EAL domain-containing protein (putative c-di-GMP-specific phosphodiesterase class I)